MSMPHLPVILISCLFSVSPVCAEGFVFTMEPLKDSLLTYESVMVRSSLLNETKERVAVGPFFYSPGFVEPTVLERETGESLTTCGGMIIEYAPDSSSVDYVEPGASLGGMSNVSNLACAVDTLSRLHYWPPGHYRVIFKRTYDPWGRALFNGSPYVVDSIDFTVVAPENRDAEALAAFLAARGLMFKESTQASIDALWEVYTRYPASVYGAEALKHIGLRWTFGSKLPRGVYKPEVAMMVVCLKPHHRRNRGLIRQVVEELSRTERKSFLRLVERSVPASSHSGQAVAKLLSEEEDRK